MTLRPLGATILLGVGLAAAAPSCNSSQFECSVDSECRLDTIEGWCESNRFCSFPAPECASGREYGDLAGDGLAGTCVPVGVGTGGDTSTGGSTDAGPADSSGDPPASCPGEIFDDFDDGALHSRWSAFGLADGQEAWVDEANGAMLVTLPAGADGYAGISLAGVVDLVDGRVRIEVPTPPGPATAIIVAVGSLDGIPGAQLLLYVYESDAALVWQPDGQPAEALADFIPLSVAQTPWVELQLQGAETGGSVALRSSSDGVDFAEVVQVPHEVLLSGSVLFVYALSFDPVAQAGDVASVSTVSVCPG